MEHTVNEPMHIGFLLFPMVTQLDLTGPAQVLSRVPNAKVHLGQTLDFLRRQGEQARYVTSVCNGALVLGAAGLLKGYKSACHWMWRKYLPNFGAQPVDARIVRDRNRISGGGVTAGIDFGLALAAELADEEVAKTLQLAFEYDPQPLFDCGSPDKAGPERVARISALQKARVSVVEEQIARAAALLGAEGADRGAQR